MKKYFVPLVVMILAVGSGCKKPNPGDGPVATPPPPPGKKWMVTTVAGTGEASFVNGPVSSATFHFPGDIAINANKEMYVTDVLNFCIRKIALGGVSKLAGGGGFGIIDGNGPAAQFKNPFSVAVDPDGNIYTTDTNDPRIRKTTPAREVTTYAGIETPGYKDGAAGIARFQPGSSIVADAVGNIYVADAGNNRIRKISLSGQVTTLAGTAQFASPGGIAIDKQGTLFVMDRGNFVIRKITADGDVSTFAGTGTAGNKDGNAGEAQFSQDMRDIVIDEAGNLYISDGDRIRKISSQGAVSTIAGSTSGYHDGEGAQAKFNFPNGLGIDAQGNIYVADLDNNRIRKISFE